MRKARKICCRITPRRVMSAVLIAASMVNLIIVGAVFEATAPTATPTVTMTHTSDPVTRTFLAPTATEGNLVTVTLESPTTWTQTPTLTSTPTETLTSTPTNTLLPSITPCIPRYYWPIYIVLRGDTLSSIARATGSSVDELMLANCLYDSWIYAGQQLYVPRLPVVPTDPPTTPPNTPTVFGAPSVCVMQDTTIITFAVTPYDPDGIIEFKASYILSGDPGPSDLAMKPNGERYYGDTSREYLYPGITISYFFTVTDNPGSVTNYSKENVLLLSCAAG